MSLNAANSIAASALSAAQYQMSVAASNVANADSEGYTKKVSALTASVTAGVGTGVSSAQLASLVDTLLTKQVTSAASALGAATASDSYADSLQALYGETASSDGSGTSIASALSDLETALTNLAATPESESLKAAVVSALESVTVQMNDLAAGIQTLRADADAEIAIAVYEANSYIAAIADLNDQIVAATARGDATADMEDQRATAVLALSELLDVKYSLTDTGAMLVYTGDTSQALVTASQTNLLEFDKAAFVSSDTTYPAGLSGISVDGKDITGSISSGSLSALFAQRDEVLVAAQQELDTLAAALIEEINAVSNAGNASPAASTLTGTATVDASDAFSATGSARIAVVDGDGALVSYGDFDLSSYATIGDLVTAIDALSGVSATIDSDGHLTITADDATTGIALAGLDGAIGSDGESLSSWFGMNDLLTGTTARDITVADTIAASSGSLPTAELSSDATLTAGDTVLFDGDTTLANALVDLMAEAISFDAAGGLGATKTSFAGYMAEMVTDKATAATQAASTLETKQTAYEALESARSAAGGVNLDEETQRLAEMEELYSIAAQILDMIGEMFDTLLAAVQ